MALDTAARRLRERPGRAAGGEGASLDWATLDEDAVRWLRSELAERYAPATVNKTLAAVRGLLRVYRREGRISEQQYQAVARVGPMSDFRRRDSRALRDAEVAALFDSCADDPTAAGRRDAALVAILLTGGLRSEELTELDAGDVRAPQRRLVVRSDLTGRGRELELSAPAVAALRDWLAVRGPDAGPLLCPVDKGGTIRLRRLTATAVLGILQRRAKAAGIEPVSARDLRRSLIVRLIAAGCALPVVRDRVGHLSWLTTAAYRELAADLAKLGAVTLELPYRPCVIDSESGRTRHGRQRRNRGRG